MKILIIDDCKIDCDLLSLNLQSAFETNSLYQNIPLEISSQLDLLQGIKQVKDSDFDLVFLDLIFDNLDKNVNFLEEPLSALKIFKDSTPLVPVIVMTSYENPLVCLQAIQEGAQDDILKGEYHGTSLLKSLGYALEKFKLEQEVREKLAELELYSKKLEDCNHDLEEFAYVASHDLQEPLRTVTAFGDKIMNECGHEMNQVSMDYLERMYRASKRMQVLLDDLLEYSRVSNRDYLFQKSKLGDILASALDNLEDRINSNKAEIKINSELLEDDILCEPFFLERAMQNIVSNSLKYRKEDQSPHIRINITKSEDSFVLEFIDNGIGFEMQFKDKIFQQFQRLHGRSEYSGTGMGLATVKKIIEKHNGAIDVETGFCQSY